MISNNIQSKIDSKINEYDSNIYKIELSINELSLEKDAIDNELYNVSQELLSNNFKWYQIKDKRTHKKSLELKKEKLEQRLKKIEIEINKQKSKKRVLLSKKKLVLNTKPILIVSIILFALILICSIFSIINTQIEANKILSEYQVTIKVNSKQNLLFNTYDINTYVDDEIIGTIANGGEDKYNLILREGEHKFTCKNAEDESVYGSLTFTITESNKYQFNVSSETSTIRISETIYDESTTTTEAITQTTTESTSSQESNESNNLYTLSPDDIPIYDEKPFVEINNNEPTFTLSDIKTEAFEFYSPLDTLNRCGIALACISKDTLLSEKKEKIEQIVPTGWQDEEYDFIGKNLYKKCSLIGYPLTAEYKNQKNIITGTQYLYQKGLQPFEKKVFNYIKKTNNHVMYRSTPIFNNDNLIAEGVQIEAYSVEDAGKGISFNVFCYNIQPGVIIDYSTGNSESDGTVIATTKATTTSSTTKQTTTKKKISTTKKHTTTTSKHYSRTVYRTPSGECYHFSSSCGGKNSYDITLDSAIGMGLRPCKKCAY